MLYNSVSFMIFLPVAVLLYYIVPQKVQKIYLLAVSYYFYACFDLRAVPFIVIATLVSFFAGKAIDGKTGGARKAALGLALTVNIGMLVYFKYANFLAGTIEGVANMLGFGLEFGKLSVLAVTGISFFTFMSVGYVADVYRGKMKAVRSFIDYSLFIVFFPHVLAGPISRAQHLIPQFSTAKKFEYSNVKKGLQLMALGFFKKVAVADVLAFFVGAVFGDITSYGGLMLIFTACIYSVQLYCDFAGYSDIARGCAKALGYEIVDNFSTPFFSTNFTQFWSKWHISLSTWMRDYIYIPLGGNRKGFARKNLNLFIVFLFSGIWHGSTWNFVIWGALHGLYRVAEEILHKYVKPSDRQSFRGYWLKYWAKVACVFGLFTFSMIFFRATTIGDALTYVGGMFRNLDVKLFFIDLRRSVATGFDATPLLIYGYLAYCILVVALTVVMDFYRQFRLQGRCLTEAFGNIKQPLRQLCYWMLIMLVLAGFIMQNGGYGSVGSFIYANF